MVNGITFIIFIVWIIVLLILYHSIFIVIYGDLFNGFLKEIAGAAFLSLLLSALTIKLWWLVAIISILFGVGAFLKSGNPSTRIGGLVAGTVIALAIAAVELSAKNKDKTESDKASTTEVTNNDESIGNIENESTFKADKNEVENNVDTQDENDSSEDNIQNYNITSSEEFIIGGDYIKDNTYSLYAWYGLDGDCIINILKGNDQVAQYYGDGHTGQYLDFDNDNNPINIKVTEGSVEIRGFGSSVDGIYSFSDKPMSETVDAVNTNGDAYIIPYSDETELDESDLQDLTAKELTYARNEIYARHGYVFKSIELRSYFITKSWYYPDDSFDGALNGVEKKNVEFISDYQNKHGLTYKPE